MWKAFLSELAHMVSHELLLVNDTAHYRLMIDFTQMTKTNLHTGRRGGDHLMNLHLAVRYDHPVD